MNIKWNKVTWYSKLLAMIIFVILPFIGFYLGLIYGETKESLNEHLIFIQDEASMNSYYSTPSEWQTDTNTSGGFSIAYPIDFDQQDSNNATKYFTLTVPKAFEPQTNFNDATLSISGDKTNAGVANCMTPKENFGSITATSSMVIGNSSFNVFESSDVGAGNYYHTMTYQTLHAGTCYSLVYTIHSSQIENYPFAYRLRQFDAAKITSLMQNIIGTFKFL